MSNSNLIVTGIACLALGAVAGHYLMPMANGGSASTRGVDTDEVKAIVADYIKENPEQIVESLQNLQRRAFEEQQAKTVGALKDHLPAITDASNSPSVGTGESGITVVEFFDYHCGFCKRMAEPVQKLLKAHPDIKVVFKEFPILSEDSQRAAQASLAVAYLAPKRYMEYHMMLMKHKGEYSQQVLNDYAGQVQVDIDAFEKEMNSDRVAKEIQTVSDLAAKVGIQGTPAMVIGGELVPGAVPFNELDKRVKALKAEKKS